jgi:hypothetical protein
MERPMSLVEHPNLFAAICVLGLKATLFEWWGAVEAGLPRSPFSVLRRTGRD